MENSEEADPGKTVFRLVGLIFIPVGLLFLVIGLISLAVGWTSWKADQAAKEWPSVSGAIIEVEIKESETHDSEGYTQENYTPKIRYRYEVDGKSYESDRLAPTFEQTYSSYEEAEAVLNVYPKGRKLDVHYQPDDPNMAALEVDGSSAGSWIAGILGACFAGFGAFFSLLGLFVFRKFR